MKTDRIDLRVHSMVKMMLQQQARLDNVSVAAWIECAVYDKLCKVYDRKDLDALFDKKKKK